MSFTFGNTFGTQILEAVRNIEQQKLDQFFTGKVAITEMSLNIFKDMIEENMNINTEHSDFVCVNENDTLIITQYLTEDAFCEELMKPSVRKMLREGVAKCDNVTMKLAITLRKEYANVIYDVQSKKLKARNRAMGFAQ